MATRAQLKKEEKRKREARRELAARVAEIRKSGQLPPDRISVFGVTQSGKSVFLASLYDILWNGVDGLSARALHGLDHQALIDLHRQLAMGRWPSATVALRAFDLALRYRGTRVTLSSLDYPGEVFTQVLFDKRIETVEQQKLYRQLQSTLGALLLIDPEAPLQAKGPRGGLDVEFTGIEVAEQLALRGMAEHFVVVLTKRNQNRKLVEEAGGPEPFFRAHFPRLAEALPDVPVLHISAVGTRLDARYRRVPDVTTTRRVEVVEPLTTLLNRIDPVFLELLNELDAAAASSILEQEDKEASWAPPNGLPPTGDRGDGRG